MLNLKRAALPALLATMAICPAAAQAEELALGAPFSDGMVLQRGQPIPVWGQGEPGSTVIVELGGENRTATVTSDGNWQVEFAAREAAIGLTLTARSGAKLVELDEIALGDVLLCSGQSNMQWTMANSALRPPHRALPVDASIRLLTVPQRFSDAEQAQFGEAATWKVAEGNTAQFSAVCLLTGRELAASSGVTVGLVHSSWGGTPIRAWMPYEALAAAGGMEETLAVLDAYRADPVAAEVEYGAALAAAEQARGSPRRTRNGRNGHANLFNAMIAPLGSMRLAGAVWYQGENEANNGEGTAGYRTLLESMIASWRGRFGSKFPFVVVQISSFGELSGEADNDNWAAVREAQRQVARADPMTELVVTIDVGERLDIHPPIKLPVGQRAGAALRSLVYGETEAYRPPQALSARRFSDAVEIAVSHPAGALFAASWGRPGPFMLCDNVEGEDCYFADALLINGGITVEVPAGRTPALVRYCWDTAPICNVFDETPMPLGPFELAVE